MTKQQQDDQSQYAIVSATDDEDGYLPVPYGLRLKNSSNAAQRKIEEEAENREVAISCHIVLAQQAQSGVGRASRVAGGQFHRTVVQGSRLLTDSKGLPLVQCEQEFTRMNLEQQMQNHFAVNDGMAQNLRDQVVKPLYEPNQKRRWWEP